MTGFEWSMIVAAATMIAAAVAMMAFMWRVGERISGVETRLGKRITELAEKVNGLGERIAHVEGLLEGMAKPAPQPPAP